MFTPAKHFTISMKSPQLPTYQQIANRCVWASGWLLLLYVLFVFLQVPHGADHFSTSLSMASPLDETLDREVLLMLQGPAPEHMAQEFRSLVSKLVTVFGSVLLFSADKALVGEIADATMHFTTHQIQIFPVHIAYIMPSASVKFRRAAPIICILC